MKKKVHLLILSIFLTGCSGLSDLTRLIATPTPVPATDTPSPSATVTPTTQNLFATSTPTPLTFTPTVTAIGAELFTPTMTATNFPTPGLPPNAINGNYFTPVNTGFLTILVSNNVMYWNEGPCSPRFIKVTAFVENVAETHRVLLFTRLREKRNTLNVTEWNSGAFMIQADNGSFNYKLETWNLRRYYYYKDAWIEYQLVGQNEDGDIIARSAIYDKNISLVQCLPVAP